MSKLDDVNDIEEKDRKYTTCIMSINDPPLEDTQGNSNFKSGLTHSTLNFVGILNFSYFVHFIKYLVYLISKG